MRKQLQFVFKRFKQFLWDLIVNNLLNSFFIPLRFRRLILKLIGCKLSTSSSIQGKFYLGSNKIILGENSFINRECYIDNAQNSYVIIGKNCSIGFRTIFITTIHDYSNPQKRGGVINSKNIIIKDGVWIGANVTILPGVTINESSVVAANSLILNNVEPNSLYAGHPAKKIRTL